MNETNPNSDRRIAVIGYLCLDLFFDLENSGDLAFVPGMLQEVGACSAFPGGVVGNTGLALHRLGIPVKLLGKIGDDALGRTIRDSFARVSPDYATHLKTDGSGHSGCCVVLSPPGGDRMFLAHRGINDALTAADATDEFLTDVGLLHFGYPPLCRGFALDDGLELQKLFRRARSRGIITSLDMSLPSPGTFSYDLDWDAFLRNTLPATDVFLPSLDELKFMLKPQPEDTLRTLRALAERLLDCGASVIGIKLGSDGLYVKTSADPGRLAFLEGVAEDGTGAWFDREFIVPCRRVNVVGTTGAGDATIAGFLAGIMTGGSAETAALLAVATGACSVTAHDSISGIRPLSDIRRTLTEGWPGNKLSFPIGTLRVLDPLPQ